MGKSGMYYKKLAEKNGLVVKNGRGYHVRIYGAAGRGYMMIPMHKELATGTENVIKKWFKALGILVVLLSPLVCLVMSVG